MKLAIESWNAATSDGLPTTPAQGALPGVKVGVTEGPTVQFHETAITKRLQTVLSLKREVEDSEGLG